MEKRVIIREAPGMPGMMGMMGMPLPDNTLELAEISIKKQLPAGIVEEAITHGSSSEC